MSDNPGDNAPVIHPDPVDLTYHLKDEDMDPETLSQIRGAVKQFTLLFVHDNTPKQMLMNPVTFWDLIKRQGKLGEAVTSSAGCIYLDGINIIRSFDIPQGDVRFIAGDLSRPLNG